MVEDRFFVYGASHLEISYGLAPEDISLKELIRDCKSLIEVIDAIDDRASKLGLTSWPRRGVTNAK